MRCITNHGSLIREIASRLSTSWSYNHYMVQDGVTQADRAYWCVRELSVRDESRLAHLTAYHWDELLSELPQEMRHGYREFAKDVRWAPNSVRVHTSVPCVIR